MLRSNAAMSRIRTHPRVRNPSTRARPTLVPAVIGYGGREEAFRGGRAFQKNGPVYHCHATRCSHEKGNHPSPFSSLPCRPTYCEKTSDTEPLLCVFATVACATMTGNCGGINVLTTTGWKINHAVTIFPFDVFSSLFEFFNNIISLGVNLFFLLVWFFLIIFFLELLSRYLFVVGL